MQDGFFKVAAASFPIKVGDCAANARAAIETAAAADQAGVRLLVLPELCLTGCTCGDLFLQPVLLDGAREALSQLIEASAAWDMLIVAGLPYRHGATVYNCAALLHQGQLLGLTAKNSISPRGALNQARQFSPAPADPQMIQWQAGEWLMLGRNLLVDVCPDEASQAAFTVACVFEEDLESLQDPTPLLARNGVSVFACPMAGDAAVDLSWQRALQAVARSGQLAAGVIVSGAGRGESTTDLTFSGQALIAENGDLLAQRMDPAGGLTITDLDVQRLAAQRIQQGGFSDDQRTSLDWTTVTMAFSPTRLDRVIDASPFLPAGVDAAQRCQEILQLQAEGLRGRMTHIGCKTAVIGLSGGLDSTLALLAAVKCFDDMGLPRTGIHAVTLPCFGTTSRTRGNAWLLAQRLGVDIREIGIADSVRSHFRDIGLPESDRSVTFENAQARERTQVLFDLANMVGGLVIGTGDLSELALGWATFNGDHMSNYGVNAGLPKTLVRAVVRAQAELTEDAALRDVLLDILATPVSPELLPPEEGDIAQKTEELVGPYELHDFYLYYALRWGFGPKKILRLAQEAFDGVYERKVLLYWLKNFYRRFFAMQFKRSCLADGPRIGSISLSPRGGWAMPSDASAALWQAELEQISE